MQAPTKTDQTCQYVFDYNSNFAISNIYKQMLQILDKHTVFRTHVYGLVTCMIFILNTYGCYVLFTYVGSMYDDIHFHGAKEKMKRKTGLNGGDSHEPSTGYRIRYIHIYIIYNIYVYI